MRFRNFDLNLLVILDVLLAERQVSRAAERLRLSQPATSNALRRLRQHFDDALLVQVGRSFTLTPLAEDLQPRVRAVLLDLGLLLDGAGARAPARPIRIMASDYVAAILLPLVARDMRESGLDAAITIVPIGPAYEEALPLGDVDLLIVPDHLRVPNEPVQSLFADGYSCLAWAGARLAQQALTREAFERAAHIVVVLGRGFRPNNVALQLAHAGLSRRFAITVPHFLMVPAYLHGTDMLAVVHTRLAHHLAAGGGLVVLDIPADLPKMVEVMQWTHHRDSDRLLGKIRAIILRAAAEV